MNLSVKEHLLLSRKFQFQKNSIKWVIKFVFFYSFHHFLKITAIENEYTLMQKLSHPNIVLYYGAEKVDNMLCIYMEYLSGGTLSSITRNMRRKTESMIRNYLIQILKGLLYLHNQNICHRDIKGLFVSSIVFQYFQNQRFQYPY